MAAVTSQAESRSAPPAAATDLEYTDGLLRTVRSKVAVVTTATQAELRTPPGTSSRFSRRDRRSIAGMTGFVLLLHVVGWGVLILAVAPHDYRLGSTGVLGVGVGLTAYMLGVRHAFDADHIASIDNTTRKLVGEGRSSVGAGFWFSLGHSSVVFAASLLLVAGVRSVADLAQGGNSQLGDTLTLVGTLVAGSFLVLIGLMNLTAAVGIARVFRRMRAGDYDEAELERHLHNRGFLSRLLGRVTRPSSRARKPRLCRWCSSSASSSSPPRIRRKTRAMPTAAPRFISPMSSRKTPATIVPISASVSAAVESPFCTTPATPRIPSASSTLAPKTTEECPRENQNPVLTEEVPSPTSLRVVLSIEAMWSASKACRTPSM